MSLDWEYSAKKFAAFVVINYSKMHFLDADLQGTSADFMNDEISREIFKCINLLLERYKDITEKINIEEIEDKHILSSKKKYFQYLYSRCMKLSEGDLTFFEFLLVCVYIGKLSDCMFLKYDCWKILKLTADCLEMVYLIKYKNYFDENGGFRGLADFCRRLNACSVSVKYEDGECKIALEGVEPERNEKVNILRRLSDVSDDIPIDFMEGKLSVDMKCFVPYRQNLSNDSLVDTRFKSGLDRDSEMHEWEIVSEKVNKTGILCRHCWAKCCQYPPKLAMILRNCETIRLKV